MSEPTTINVCIFTDANDLFEYEVATRDDAVSQYVKDQLIDQESFTLDEETWDSIKSIVNTENENFGAFINLVNGLCSNYSQKIVKVLSGYSKDYSVETSVEETD